MTPRAEGVPNRFGIAAPLLLLAFVAPAGEHLYWALGGTWGLHTSTSTGVRVVAGAVVSLVVGAALVVLARVGWWRQRFVSERVIRFLAWGVAVFFLGHGLASFAEGALGIAEEWWLYGPGGLVIGMLALVVARGTEAMGDR